MDDQQYSDALERVKEYLVDGVDLDNLQEEPEKGCLITSDGLLIPFKNEAEDPRALIRQGVPSFQQMCKLFWNGELYGWAHSHPRWAPYPSVTDIVMHRMPIHMLIYSVVEDRLLDYTPEEIDLAARALSCGAASVRNDGWKPIVTNLFTEKKEVPK